MTHDVGGGLDAIIGALEAEERIAAHARRVAMEEPVEEANRLRAIRDVIAPLVEPATERAEPEPDRVLFRSASGLRIVEDASGPVLVQGAMRVRLAAKEALVVRALERGPFRSHKALAAECQRLDPHGWGCRKLTSVAASASAHYAKLRRSEAGVHLIARQKLYGLAAQAPNAPRGGPPRPPARVLTVKITLEPGANAEDFARKIAAAVGGVVR